MGTTNTTDTQGDGTTLDFDYVIEGEVIDRPVVDQEDDTNLERDPLDVIDDDDEDERETHDEGLIEGTSDEREAIRERRRLERKTRKEAQRAREEDLRNQVRARDRQLEELTNRLSAVENRTSGADISRIDEGIRQTNAAYDFFKQQLAKATTEGNGDAAAEATEKMFQVRQRAAELDSLKKNMVKANTAPQPLDARMVNHANGWMKKNSWYSPENSDSDSQVVTALDRALASEGFDPSTEAYWEELTRRTEKYLPHRVKRGKIETVEKTPRSPVPAGKPRGGNPAKGGAFTLSRDRVEAMKEAGVWDDPKARNDMIRRYREADQNAKKG